MIFWRKKNSQKERKAVECKMKPAKPEEIEQSLTLETQRTQRKGKEKKMT